MTTKKKTTKKKAPAKKKTTKKKAPVRKAPEPKYIPEDFECKKVVAPHPPLSEDMPTPKQSPRTIRKSTPPKPIIVAAAAGWLALVCYMIYMLVDGV